MAAGWGVIGSAVASPEFDAPAWLSSVERAASSGSYRGTLTVTSGGVVSSSRVSHLVERQQRYERIELLGGQARQQYRHNDLVLTVWPQARLAVFEPQDSAPEFPGLPRGSRRLLESYELKRIGQERVAGQVTDVVMVKPKDTLRFAQRLWAVRDGGMLVRADVLGPGGEVLESSAFSELQLGQRLPVDSVTGPMRKLNGYRVVRPQSQPVRLEAEGWVIQRTVPGFAMVGCARRALDPLGSGGDERQVVHAVFSDGLAVVSVFIEPYDGSRHKSVRTSLGAAHTSMSRQGDWWVTVVGDVPMSTIQQFEASLQRR